ncbi:MAG TPA: hypothetical protein VGP33_02640 [Chloroflexota bacterium]|jgi:hypothetical protein|nr:hypothetical protein [Chloroflexota bacterium]
MTQSSPEQRAEAARLLALRDGDIWWPSYEEWGDLLLSLLPALLADAEALAAIEAAEVRQALRDAGHPGDDAQVDSH